MGAEVFLEAIDHLLSMVVILDGEEHTHRKGEQSNQTGDDLKPQVFVKFCLFHKGRNNVLKIRLKISGIRFLCNPSVSSAERFGGGVTQGFSPDSSALKG